MKKLLTFLVLLGTVASGLAQPSAPRWEGSSFLKDNCQVIYVGFGLTYTNPLVTLNGGVTNNVYSLPYLNTQSNMLFALTATNVFPTMLPTYVTNVFAGVTNVATVGYTYYWTNTAAYTSTNVVGGGVATNSIGNFPEPFNDGLALFSDRNGNGAAASIAVAFGSATNNITNTLTFTFASGAGPVHPGNANANGINQTIVSDPFYNVFWGTASQDQFTFSVTNGTPGTINTVITNLPTSFTQQGGQIALVSVTASSLGTNVANTVAGITNNIALYYVGLLGYRP